LSGTQEVVVVVMKLPTDKSRLLAELVSRDILTPLVKVSSASYYIDSVTSKIKVELREKPLDHNWIHNDAPLGGNCEHSDANREENKYQLKALKVTGEHQKGMPRWGSTKGRIRHNMWGASSVRRDYNFLAKRCYSQIVTISHEY
jgi:hypothetical protein